MSEEHTGLSQGMEELMTGKRRRSPSINSVDEEIADSQEPMLDDEFEQAKLTPIIKKNKVICAHWYNNRTLGVVANCKEHTYRNEDYTRRGTSALKACGLHMNLRCLDNASLKRCIVEDCTTMVRSDADMCSLHQAKEKASKKKKEKKARKAKKAKIDPDVIASLTGAVTDLTKEIAELKEKMA
jgi:hypothetical protein